MPMRLARGHGEGRGHGDELRALLRQRAEKMGKAHVVADGEADRAQ